MSFFFLFMTAVMTAPMVSNAVAPNFSNARGTVACDECHRALNNLVNNVTLAKMLQTAEEDICGPLQGDAAASCHQLFDQFGGQIVDTIWSSVQNLCSAAKLCPAGLQTVPSAVSPRKTPRCLACEAGVGALQAVLTSDFLKEQLSGALESAICTQSDPEVQKQCQTLVEAICSDLLVQIGQVVSVDHLCYDTLVCWRWRTTAKPTTVGTEGTSMVPNKRQ